MNANYDTVYQELSAIYNKHRRKFKNHPNSNQMCLMWSTNNPPDTIVDTKPIYDIEDTFDIDLDETMAMELYDMNIDEAAKKIIEIQNAMG
jgi:hypothetical protein